MRQESIPIPELTSIHSAPFQPTVVKQPLFPLVQSPPVSPHYEPAFVLPAQEVGTDVRGICGELPLVLSQAEANHSGSWELDQQQQLFDGAVENTPMCLDGDDNESAGVPDDADFTTDVDMENTPEDLEDPEDDFMSIVDPNEDMLDVEPAGEPAGEPIGEPVGEPADVGMKRLDNRWLNYRDPPRPTATLLPRSAPRLLLSLLVDKEYASPLDPDTVEGLSSDMEFMDLQGLWLQPGEMFNPFAVANPTVEGEPVVDAGMPDAERFVTESGTGSTIAAVEGPYTPYALSPEPAAPLVEDSGAQVETATEMDVLASSEEAMETAAPDAPASEGELSANDLEDAIHELAVINGERAGERSTMVRLQETEEGTTYFVSKSENRRLKETDALWASNIPEEILRNASVAFDVGPGPASQTGDHSDPAAVPAASPSNPAGRSPSLRATSPGVPETPHLAPAPSPSLSVDEIFGEHDRAAEDESELPELPSSDRIFGTPTGGLPMMGITAPRPPPPSSDSFRAPEPSSAPSSTPASTPAPQPPRTRRQLNRPILKPKSRAKRASGDKKEELGGDGGRGAGKEKSSDDVDTSQILRYREERVQMYIENGAEPETARQMAEEDDD